MPTLQQTDQDYVFKGTRADLKLYAEDHMVYWAEESYNYHHLTVAEKVLVKRWFRKDTYKYKPVWREKVYTNPAVVFGDPNRAMTHFTVALALYMSDKKKWEELYANQDN